MTVFLDACRKKPTPHTPIWLMRQAGRYQPEYRAIRERVSFIDLCKSPDLATEVTLLPVTQLGVDAAIVFADILLILEPLGVGFEFTSDDGPKIHKPIRSAADIDAVSSDTQPACSLAYVMQTVKQVRQGLSKDVSLIGFSGSPFTLASYIIEGQGSKNYLHTKALMYRDEPAWRVLMTKLAYAVRDYLNAQIDAGADAVQLFDSWVGCLSPDDYARYVKPYVKLVFDGLCREVPAIHFGTGNPDLYPAMRDAGGDVIGIDWRTRIDKQWEALGDVALMGNLDPAYLIAPREVMFDAAKTIVHSVRARRGHIFNLGHGVYPSVSVEQARALVDCVHEASARS